MAEQLESLLKRIEDEAVTRLDSQTKEKIEQAEQQSQKIVADAQAKAKSILEDAEKQAALREDNGRKNLEQAARDYLLLIKKSVTEQMTQLVKQSIDKSADAAFLTEVLGKMLPMALEMSKGGVVVELAAADQEKLSSGFMASLAAEVKKGVELRPVKGVRSGFKLTLEGQNVQFDFSDEALVEMLSQLVNKDVEKALRQAAGSAE